MLERVRRAFLLALLTLAACGSDPEPVPFDPTAYFASSETCRAQLVACVDRRDPAACLLDLCRAENGSTCAFFCTPAECGPACELEGGTADVCDADPCTAIQCPDTTACF